MDTSKILTTVDEITQKLKTNGKTDTYIEQLKEEYNELYDTYPAIFKMTCDGTMDIKRLKFMLNMKNNIDNNKITEHDASVEVGQLLVDEIVKPQLK